MPLFADACRSSLLTCMTRRVLFACVGAPQAHPMPLRRVANGNPLGFAVVPEAHQVQNFHQGLALRSGLDACIASAIPLQCASRSAR